jgi:glycosyltransferase involved in cell wall biosynthesis
MLVSFLMPTVNQHDWLIRALNSIKSTATNFSEVEILLRVDDHDIERILFLPALKEIYGVNWKIGPGVGYKAMSEYVKELLDIAKGKWVWLFDDDAWIEGNWQKQLEAIKCDPQNGPAVQPDCYQLGPSVYPVGCGPVSLILPLEFARTNLLQQGAMIDQSWLDVIHQREWRIKHLNHVSYCHDGRQRNTR